MYVTIQRKPLIRMSGQYGLREGRVCYKISVPNWTKARTKMCLGGISGITLLVQLLLTTNNLYSKDF